MDSDSHFKSLFLPLKSTDCAVFASVCPLLALATAATPAPDPSDPCDYYNTSEQRQNTAHVVGVFSPTETGARVVEQGSAADLHTLGSSDAAPHTRSALFASLSARADGAVAVLRTREVVFFRLTDAKRGPVELTRFAPLPTTVEAESGVALPSGTGYAISAKSEATCAALLPLELAHLCRVDTKLPEQEDATSGTLYLRGLVGCGDGRVYVFSERGYAFGFAAHDCPVSAVHAIYSYGQELTPAVAAEPRPLSRAMRHLGFVTSGKSGTVYVWRQHVGGSVKPQLLSGATSIHRTVALCVYQAPAHTWLGAHALATAAAGVGLFGAASSATLPVFTASASGDVGLVEDVLPCPQALFAIPGVRRCVRCQALSARAMRAEGNHSLITTMSTAEVHDYVLPDVSLYTTTAIATDGELGVLAYSNKLQVFPMGSLKPLDTEAGGVTHPAEHAGEPVFTAAKPISHVVLQGSLCAVVCARAGLVYLLSVPSFRLLGQYRSFENRPIASATLYPAARLLVLVDARCGSVELVQLQESLFAAHTKEITDKLSGTAMVQETFADLPAGARELPSAVALRYACAREAIAQSAVAPTDAAALRQQDELRAYEEALLLSAVGVPAACDAFLTAHGRIA